MRQIYEEVARENGWSQSMTESVGVEILSTLREKLNAPDQLAYELPKLGTFTLKHNKYASFHEYLLKAIEQGTYVLGENYSTEMYSRNEILMSKINEFRQDKAEVKKLKDEAKANKSSQGQLD